MPPTPIMTFLHQVETLLKSGHATEHSYRPALEQLFSTVLAPAQAINEPQHAKYGAPDFVIQRESSPIGHVEAKDVGIGLSPAIVDSEKTNPSTSNGKQLKRYRAALPNLLYTDGLEWHWFVDGLPRLLAPATIATWNKTTKKLQVHLGAEAVLASILQQFAAQDALTISTPRDLAGRLAQIARWLRDVIADIFSGQGDEGSLHQQLKAFQTTLLPTLTPEEFADMYAQTLVYGLFAARVAQPDQKGFTRHDAGRLIPKTNPFLRRLFREVTDDDLDERIAWLVDDCARLLAHTDMAVVMQDFGRATRQEDPVVHFYETFLAAYDPKMRESRGVYYTPEPVVSYIVRSVDMLLRTRFGKRGGLADDKTVILDPATGTATFLHAVVQQIHSTLKDQGMEGTWNSYVPQKLLPRLFGFELLMAPYTVAHLKMGLLLAELGYTFGSNERLGIYLTNTLADVPTAQQPLAFAQYIAAESQAANEVKQIKPVMVVLGNPPYSGHSANRSAWIEGLLKGRLPDNTSVSSYYEVDGKPLGERNSKWLQDDYVKFIRFGQWRINRSGEGILAFISNNGYLDNPTFRGMRQSLLQEFDTIYILNLHGNSKKRERTPEGEPDENVFDIQQGVAIGIFVRQVGKSATSATVHYADIWGKREHKYDILSSFDVSTTTWQELSPSTPWHLFIPQNLDLRAEYEQGWKVTEAFPLNILGFQTHRDPFAIAFGKGEIHERVNEMRDPNISDDALRRRYNLTDNRDWLLPRARSRLQANSEWEKWLVQCAYRPFDLRFTYLSEMVGDYPRLNVMRHLLSPNLAFATTRQTKADAWQHFLASENPTPAVYVEIKDGCNVFPLYVYPNSGEIPLHGEQVSLLTDEVNSVPDGRHANLSPTFTAELEQRLTMQFIPDGKGDLQQTFGPEDVFHYAYTIFHSPTYRERYAEFLKIDFPRLPLTSDRQLFAALAEQGAALVDLHLLRLPGNDGVGGAGGAAVLENTGRQGVSFPLMGTNIVDKVQYNAPLDEARGYVSINDTQRFTGVEPETWDMQIGGYQPLEKWLKDRKGRELSVDDIQHYLRVIVALRETRRIMANIDTIIPAWPIA